MAQLKTKLVISTPLEIYEFTGEPGDYVVTGAPADMSVADMAASLIFVRGQFTLTRTKGKPKPPCTGSSVRNPGDTSFEVTHPDIGAGEWRKQVTSEETAVYYCCSHTDRRRLTRRAVRLARGGSSRIAKGEWMFLAYGSGAVNGKAFDALQMLYAKSGNVEFVATSDKVYGLIFGGL